MTTTDDGRNNTCNDDTYPLLVGVKWPTVGRRWSPLQHPSVLQVCNQHLCLGLCTLSNLYAPNQRTWYSRFSTIFLCKNKNLYFCSLFINMTIYLCDIESYYFRLISFDILQHEIIKFSDLIFAYIIYVHPLHTSCYR